MPIGIGKVNHMKKFRFVRLLMFLTSMGASLLVATSVLAAQAVSVKKSSCVKGKACQCSQVGYQELGFRDRSLVRKVKVKLENPEVQTSDNGAGDWCVRTGSGASFYKACNACKGSACCVGTTSGGSSSYQCYSQDSTPEKPVKVSVFGSSNEDWTDAKEDAEDNKPDREDIEPPREEKGSVGRQ